MNKILSSATSLVVMATATVSPGSSPDLPARPAAISTTKEVNAAAEEVLTFWEAAGPSLWFAKDPAFDQRFRQRFLARYEAAVRGELESWSTAPRSALALIILLDQFPRNSFRGTPRMYATDEAARRFADAAIAAGYDRSVPKDLRLFMYLPFAHSESLADQERSVELARRLSEDDLSHAEHHRDIVRRFGRFPHRNAILGRISTAEEVAYLESGGYRG
ncbi:MAG: DUF924 family protein [Steroidobacteraceae bacterium]